jgi:3-phosphoshikimate 1-carboxyvinyltransferase
MEGLISSKGINLNSKSLNGTLSLSGSKSISNRVLLIKALCNKDFLTSNLSDSVDTKTMKGLLSLTTNNINVGHAGTAYRFGTAFLALQDGEYTLSGSDRMHNRPIGPLVKALQELGADIQYLDKKGFPPLKIKSPQWKTNVVSIDASVSSQYISALLLIAPLLPNGIELQLQGKMVSRSYIDMTLSIMEYFGVCSSWNANIIKIKPQSYIAKDIFIEGDWSSASYWYGHAAIAEKADLNIKGLSQNSYQGDSKIAEVMQQFGLLTTFHDDNSINIHKNEHLSPKIIELDFSNMPDLVQTLSVICAVHGTTFLFTGAETLKIKETDRIAALKAELLKFDVHLIQVPSKFSKKSENIFYLQEGKVKWEDNISIDTYQDHRMAMSFAIISHVGEITIKNPSVVKKSYPSYWGDINKVLT